MVGGDISGPFQAGKIGFIKVFERISSGIMCKSGFRLLDYENRKPFF